MRREDMMSWSISVGIHVVLALVANMLFYETRESIGSPQMTILFNPPTRQPISEFRSSTADFAANKPRLMPSDDDDDAYVAAPDASAGPPVDLWLPEDGEPIGFERCGGGGRPVIRMFT